MTVKELITLLVECDPEREVYIAQDDHYYTHLKAYSVISRTMDVQDDNDDTVPDQDVVTIDFD